MFHTPPINDKCFTITSGDFMGSNRPWKSRDKESHSLWWRIRHRSSIVADESSLNGQKISRRAREGEVSLMRSGARTYGRGVTLLEVLVVIVVIALCVAISLPSLISTRLAARGVATVSNMSQIGSALSAYGTDNHELPPVVFRAGAANYHLDPVQEVTLNDQIASGYWFDNSHFYHMAISPSLPRQVLIVPGAPEFAVLKPPRAISCRFALTECFYAECDYWHSVSSQRADMMRPQRWSEISFPSAKGILQQLEMWGHPLANQFTYLPGNARVESGVLWGDLSVTRVRQGLLRPGIPNKFDHYYVAGGGEPLPTTISRTRDGLHGIDR
jgi:prepilin-type N-terminal cleavage/methylation domain-containing protein